MRRARALRGTRRARRRSRWSSRWCSQSASSASSSSIRPPSPTFSCRSPSTPTPPPTRTRPRRRSWTTSSTWSAFCFESKSCLLIRTGVAYTTLHIHSFNNNALFTFCNRLFYSFAMSPKFLSRLWRQCTKLQRAQTGSSSSVAPKDFWMYASNQSDVSSTALIGLLGRGETLSDSERDLLVSRLGLFCTLFSLTLCTLHDDEFLGNLKLDPHLTAQIPTIVDKGRVVSFHPHTAANAESQMEISETPNGPHIKTMPFTLEELQQVIRILLSVSSSLLELSLPFQHNLSNQSTHLSSTSFHIQWRYIFLVRKLLLTFKKFTFKNTIRISVCKNDYPYVVLQ